jgi:chromosome segregation ATPase
MTSQSSRGNGGLLTLKEASKVTGLNIQTLRSRIKRGALKGFKKSSQFGEVWYIKADSVANLAKLEHDRLKVLSISHEHPSSENPSQSHSKDAEIAIRSKESQIEVLLRLSTSLEKQNCTYEQLLRDFHARINILESDKALVENKLKALPLPAEMVCARLSELERSLSEKDDVIKAEVDHREQLSAVIHEQKARLLESERRLLEFEKELQDSRRPWWKKLLGAK